MTIFELEPVDDNETEDIPPLLVEEEQAIHHAISLIQNETGWGEVVLTFQDKRLFDLRARIDKRMKLKRG